MKKIGMLLLFFCFVLFVITAEARYVRKVREPDFFIPEKDRMHKPEKLPKVKVVVVEKKDDGDDKEKVFQEVPEYKNKYNRYLSDMNAFKTTGVMPENQRVEADLAEMASGNIFEVADDESQTIKTEEQKNFYLLAKEIMKN